MSLDESIDQITEDELSGISIRAGNGMSLNPCEEGQPVLSRRDTASSDEAHEPGGFPRHGSPLRRVSNFLCNLIPIRETSEDLSELIPLSNVKMYVALTLRPVAYLAATGPDLYDISYAEVVSLSTVLVPHGTTLENENASVGNLDGSETVGRYYFYYARLFSDGTVLGFSGAESNSDIDYFYTNLATIGWLQSPAGTHYPPIDLV